MYRNITQQKSEIITKISGLSFSILEILNCKIITGGILESKKIFSYHYSPFL